MMNRPRYWRLLESLCGWVMVKSTRLWANYFMDQFDNYKFQCNYGHTVFVSISYYSEWPDAFDDLDNPPAARRPWYSLATYRDPKPYRRRPRLDQ